MRSIFNRGISRRLAGALTIAIGLGAGIGASLHAQELKDELDALEDVPADDLSDLDAAAKDAPKKTAKAPTKAAPEAAAAEDAEALDPLDDLPTDDLEAELKSSEKKAPTQAPKTAEAEIPPAKEDALDDMPTDDAVEDLGTETADTDAGLEQELRSLDDRKKPDAGPPVTAMTGVENEPTGKIVGLDFRQLPDRVRLTVRGDRVIDWSRELRSKRKQVILEMRNMNLSRKVLRRALDTGEFDGPVALVQAFDSKAGSMPTVKVLFQLRKFTDPTVMKSGNDLIIDFPVLTDMTIFRSKTASRVEIPETFMSLTDKMPSVGHKITLNVKEAELQDVLNLLSRSSGRNFVLAGGAAANAKVTLNVRNIPWDEVLRVILVNAKLGYQKVGNVYRIAPLADLRGEIEEATKTAAASEELIPLETRLYALSYAKSDLVQTNVKDFVTKRGKVSVEGRTNTIVVTDIPETLEKISRYIKSIDRQTAQILIEGRVVEASKDFNRNFGVAWGYNKTSLGPIKNPTLNFGANNLANQAYNTAFDLGTAGSWGQIRARLSAAEEDRTIRTIASPRVLVLDNSTANAKQGQTVLVTVPPSGSQNMTNVYVPPVPVQADLELSVKPQVTSDGYVLMDLTLKRETVIVDAAPGSKNSREVKTQVLVESGKTVVIGGIYTTDKQRAETGLPWFRSIPVVGLLFTNSIKISESVTELLMFISPKITNADKAFLANVERDLGDDEGDGPRPISSIQSEQVPDDVF